MTALRVLLAFLILVFSASPPLAALSQTAEPSYFGTREVREDNLSAFTKWLGALDKFAKDRKRTTPLVCNPGPGQMKICGNTEWINFLRSIKSLPKLEQLRAVNARINKATYVQDQANWGVSDYWESPDEFMARFGDCEDYAIIKYLSLRLLGWPDDDLRVVAVKDLNLKVGHAILIAFLTARNGQRVPLVLDNQIPDVVKASSIRHYQPVFSINQHHWWRHLG